MQFYSYEDIKSAANCREVAEQLLGLKLSKDGRCAATWRGGDNPTSVSINEDGWYDHVKEEKGSVIDLVARVKFGGDVQQAQEAVGKFYSLTPKMSTQKRLPGEAPKNAHERLLDDGFQEVTRYDYVDENGELRHQVVRLEHPEPDARGNKRKEFLQARPGGRWGVSGVELVLYNLPEAKAASWLLIPEGEKDVDTLKALGLPATTNSGGAGKWLDSYDHIFADKDIVILPDDDDKGTEHQKVVASHAKKGGAKSIRAVTLSSVTKGDVTDWLEREGGTVEKLRELIGQAPALNPADIPDPGDSGSLDMQKAKSANKYPFKNFILQEVTLPNGATKKEPRPRKLTDLVTDCHERFLGFPRKVGESLFDHDRDSGKIVYLNNAAALFSWIQLTGGIVTDWKQGPNYVTKHEFFSGLVARATRYEAISSVPDWPILSTTYYTHDGLPSPSEGHKAFETLVNFFCPASEEYVPFLRALMAAPLFYRPGVPRPAWIIDSTEGQGAGKTVLAELVAMLYGRGPNRQSPRDLRFNLQEVTKNLLTSQGRTARIFLLDNVTGNLICPEFADLVTRQQITGRSVYARDEETRPNNLTYIITSNTATVDNDIAERSFYLYIKKPKRSGRWQEMVESHIKANRLQIMADIIDILKTHEENGFFDTVPVTRFPEFEERIFQAMCGTWEAYCDAVKVLTESRSESNLDEEQAQQIEDIIRAELVECGVNPAQSVAFITSGVIKEWLSDIVEDLALPPIQLVRNLAKSGLLPHVDKSKRRLYHHQRRSSGVTWMSDEPPKSYDLNNKSGVIEKIIIKRGKTISVEPISSSQEDENSSSAVGF